MGANPAARNADYTGVYYDGNGDVQTIVHPDNDDFRGHQYPGLRGVIVLYAEFAAAPAAFNFRGVAKHLGLTKAIMPRIREQHPIFAAIVQNRIDAFDAWFADVGAAQAAADNAEAAFLAALTPLHRFQWNNNIATAADLLVFVASLSVDERAAYDAMVSARQGFRAVLLAGPNP